MLCCVLACGHECHPSRLAHSRPSLPSREAEASNQPRVVPPPLIKPSSFARFPLPRERCPVHTSPFLHHGGRNGLRVQLTSSATPGSPRPLTSPCPFSSAAPRVDLSAGLGVLCIFAPAVADQRPRQNPTTPPLFCAQHNIPQERTYSGRAFDTRPGRPRCPAETASPATDLLPAFPRSQQQPSQSATRSSKQSTPPPSPSRAALAFQATKDPCHTTHTANPPSWRIRRRYLLANPYHTSRHAFPSGASPRGLSRASGDGYKHHQCHCKCDPDRSWTALPCWAAVPQDPCPCSQFQPKRPD